MKTKKTIFISMGVFLIVGITVIIIFMFSGKKIDNNYFDKIIMDKWSIEKTDDCPEFLLLLEEKSTFNVTGFVDNGEGHYTVNVEVKSPDIYQSIIELQESINKKIDTSEIDRMLTEIITTSSLKSSSHELSVIVTEEGTTVSFTEEFIDAMYGYAYSYSISKLNEVLKY